MPRPPGAGHRQVSAEQTANRWSGRRCLWEYGNLRLFKEKSATSEKFLPWEDLKRFRVKQLILMDWKWLDYHEQHSLQSCSPEPGNAPVMIPVDKADERGEGRCPGSRLQLGQEKKIWYPKSRQPLSALVSIFLANRCNYKCYNYAFVNLLIFFVALKFWIMTDSIHQKCTCRKNEISSKVLAKGKRGALSVILWLCYQEVLTLQANQDCLSCSSWSYGSLSQEKISPWGITSAKFLLHFTIVCLEITKSTRARVLQLWPFILNNHGLFTRPQSQLLIQGATVDSGSRVQPHSLLVSSAFVAQLGGEREWTGRKVNPFCVAREQQTVQTSQHLQRLFMATST